MYLIIHICLLFFFLRSSCSDWVSEWMDPMERHYKYVENTFDKNLERNKDYQRLPSPRETPAGVQDTDAFAEPELFRTEDHSTTIETTINKAIHLVEALRKQIINDSKREIQLKEAIVNGKPGVTTATVTTSVRLPRNYIIRNGSWAICKGIILYPNHNQVSTKRRVNVPTCSGQEITTKRDKCVFNSIIKYQTVPSIRRSTYEEDNYLCQKNSFNGTFEKYMSVPQSVVQQTCGNDITKKLSDNLLDCGPRIVTEYTFYSYTQSPSALPVGYCTQKDGSCKLTVAWHLTNVSIENFEFFDIDQKFRQYFIKPEPLTYI